MCFVNTRAGYADCNSDKYYHFRSYDEWLRLLGRYSDWSASLVKGTFSGKTQDY